MLTLIDNGTGFSVVSENTNFFIKYGEFALVFSNIDINKLMEPLRKFYLVFEISARIECLPPKYDSDKKIRLKNMDDKNRSNASSLLRNPLLKLLQSNNQTTNQSKIITDLLIEELEGNILSGSFNWKDDTTFVPAILRDIKLRSLIQSILLRQSETFNEDINKKFSGNLHCSIVLDTDGKLKPIYLIKDTYSLLILDLIKYLDTNIHILKCKKCGRLFYPTSKNQKYCSFLNYDENGKESKKCSELVHNTPTDYTALAFRRVRGAQNGRVENVIRQKNSSRFKYDVDKLQNYYENWKSEFMEECAKCRDELRILKNFTFNEGFKYTTDEFDIWVKEHEFTPEYLEKNGIRKNLKKEKNMF